MEGIIMTSHAAAGRLTTHYQWNNREPGHKTAWAPITSAVAQHQTETKPSKDFHIQQQRRHQTRTEVVRAWRDLCPSGSGMKPAGGCEEKEYAFGNGQNVIKMGSVLSYRKCCNKPEWVRWVTHCLKTRKERDMKCSVRLWKFHDSLHANVKSARCFEASTGTLTVSCMSGLQQLLSSSFLPSQEAADSFFMESVEPFAQPGF